ncbi:MAG TPA: hypothetical protein VMF14_22405 [Solirubrobacteraceae bacterium]|nr:hypothetical protein [Solirubrobacteraceae bacterium]
MTEPHGVVSSTDDGAVGAGVARSSTHSESSRGHSRQADASPHSGRFRTITALLVALGIGAIVVAVAVAVNGRGSSAAAPKWSAWRPPDGGTQGAQDIANFIAPFYRIDSHDQLALVTVVNLESQSAIAAQQQAAANGTTAAPSSGLEVAVRPSTTSSQVSLLSGNTIGYNLCGIGGKNCAIGVGTPSTNRLLLLRREALELALYTFTYVSGTQNVVAILPPGHTEQSTPTLSKKPPKPTSTQVTTKPVNIAVLFSRQELAPLLKHPLSDILPEQVPPSVAQMPHAPEAGLVDQVTARGLFSEQIQQAQDGSNLIVLDPLPPQ